MSWKTHLAAISVVALLVFFTNLGRPRLWDRDEPRNAGCAAEMLDRADWVTPVFNGELRSHKPVLLYWFMMSAYAVLGVNEFSARFWSALLAVGTCFCTYAIGRRLFGGRVGLWAAIILATTMMFDVAGRAATPDSVLIFFCTLAITWYVCRGMPGLQDASHEASADDYFPRKWSFAAVLYGIMAIAVLAKGPIGVILPTAVIGLFLLIRRARSSYGQPTGWRRVLRPLSYFLETCWRMRVLSATGIVLAIALPWYVWVGIRTDGAWLRGFFLEHNLGRAVNAMEGHGGNALLFYPVALLLGFAPWSVFMAPTLIDGWKRVRRSGGQRDGLLLAACWMTVYVGLFSLASTKLPSYITPCYPGVALLVGAFVDRWSRDEAEVSPWWPRIGLTLWATVGLALIVGLPMAAERYLPGMQWLGLVGAIPLVAGAIALVSLRLQRADAAARAFALGAFLFVWVSFSFVTLHVDSQQRFHEVLAELKTHTDTPELGYFQTLEPSWVFYHQDAIKPVYVGGDPTSPSEGVRSGGVWVQHAPMEARKFILQNPDRFVLTTREQYERIQDQLPADIGVVSERPYFLKDHSIVAIGQLGKRVARLKNDRSRR